LCITAFTAHPVLALAVPAGFAVSLHCPTVAIKLTSNHQPQTAQLVAELRGLQLTTPATGSAAVTVQQLQVLLNSTQPNSSPSPSRSSSSSSGSTYVPVLQLPKLDDLRANLTHETRSSSATNSTSGGSNMQAAAAGLGGAAQSPRPSALGRIYQDSLISAYISKLHVWDQNLSATVAHKHVHEAGSCDSTRRPVPSFGCA
jgi:hypothetical protein